MGAGCKRNYRCEQDRDGIAGSGAQQTGVEFGGWQHLPTRCALHLQWLGAGASTEGGKEPSGSCWPGMLLAAALLS